MLLYLRRDGVPKDMFLATQYYRFRSTPIINFQRQACDDLGRVAGGGALLTPVEIRELSSDGSVNRKTRHHSKPVHYTRLQAQAPLQAMLLKAPGTLRFSCGEHAIDAIAVAYLTSRKACVVTALLHHRVVHVGDRLAVILPRLSH